MISKLKIVLCANNNVKHAHIILIIVHNALYKEVIEQIFYQFLIALVSMVIMKILQVKIVKNAPFNVRLVLEIQLTVVFVRVIEVLVSNHKDSLYALVK